MFNKPTSEPVGPEQNKMEPVGPRPKIRPVRLGLHALFSKKPETEPDLWARAQARPTSMTDLSPRHILFLGKQDVQLMSEVFFVGKNVANGTAHFP